MQPTFSFQAVPQWQLLEASALLAARPSLPPWRLQIIGPIAVPQGGGGEAYRERLEARFRPGQP